jgi:hypothetical protein
VCSYSATFIGAPAARHCGASYCGDDERSLALRVLARALLVHNAGAYVGEHARTARALALGAAAATLADQAAVGALAAARLRCVYEAVLVPSDPHRRAAARHTRAGAGRWLQRGCGAGDGAARGGARTAKGALEQAAGDGVQRG